MAKIGELADETHYRNPQGAVHLAPGDPSGLEPKRWAMATQTALSDRFPSVDAPFQARENVGVVAARGRMLSSVRPLMRQDDSRRPVWEFADRVQITRSVLEAQWKALVVPAPSRRLLRHTLLPLALTSSRSWSAYAAATGVL